MLPEEQEAMFDGESKGGQSWAQIALRLLWAHVGSWRGWFLSIFSLRQKRT